MSDLESLKRQLAKEKKARIAAEKALDLKDRELQLRNVRLEENDSMQTSQIQGINDIVNNLLDKNTIEGVCSAITSSCIRNFHLEDCVIYLLDKSDDVLKQTGNQSRISPLLREPEIPKGKGIVGKVALTGQSVVVHSNELSEISSPDGLKKYSELAIPLIADGELIGVLDSAHSARDFFDDDYLALLNTIANLAVVKIRDILTKENQQSTESLLLENQKKFRQIVEGAQEIIFECDPKGYFTYGNPTFFKVLGYQEEDLHQLHFLSLVSSTHRTEVLDFYLSHLSQKSSDSDIEFPARTKEGDILWIAQHTNFQYDEEENLKGIFTVARDITDRRNFEKNLKIQEEKYRNIINNMNLGLLEVDQDDTIIFANKSFINMSGYDEKELIGLKAAELFMANDDKEIIHKKNKLREQGITDIYDVPVKNKKGESRWWLISGAPNYNDQGHLIGSIGIHFDMTDQKLLEQKLAAALSKAEESSRVKEVFLTNMSHEIRTPLNAIIGIVREFPTNKLDATQERLLHDVQNSAQHLLSIVNNILDITKIGSGEFQLDKHPFKPIDVLNDTYSIFNTQAETKGIQLLFFPGGNYLDHFYLGDSTRFKQVLINLIGNSIKFTNEGKITIHCRMTEKSPTIHQVQIKVEDTGIGMDEEYKQNLFTQFTQEDKTITRKYGGTGLGMALTNEIIHLLDGTIEVTSIKNKGTIIDVSFPLEYLKEYTEKNVNTDYGAGLQDCRILLVEDNQMNRMVVKMTLKPYHCQIVEAENGEVALEILEKQSFDVILMDLQMPVKDGLETTNEIRTRLKIQTPIIALTANALKNTIDQCMALGMDAYITKPFDKSTLLQGIYNQFRKPLQHQT